MKKSVILLVILCAALAHAQTPVIGGGTPIVGGGTQITVTAYCNGVAPSGATISFFTLGANSSPCATVPGGSGGYGWMATSPGTVSKLTLRCANPGIDATSGVTTLYVAKAGVITTILVTTGLQVTYGTTPINTLVVDSTHTYAYSPGDVFTIRATTFATGETLGNCTVSFEHN